MPWIVPLNKLDTEQRGVLDRLLREAQPHWIRGFAGSGKSVVLIHGVRELLVSRPRASACIVAFTHSLKDMLRSGLPENARHIPVMTYHDFRKNPAYYDYIFVDEVQDLERDILQLLRSNCGTLVMAGDEEQSIYEQRVSPSDIKTLTGPIVHSLMSIYRLTEKLRKVVATILPKSRVMSARNARLAADVKVTVARARNLSEELSWVWREAQRATRAGDPVVVLLPKQRLIQDFISWVCREKGIAAPSYPRVREGGYMKTDYSVANQHLAAHGMMLRYLGNDYGELEEAERGRIVFVMTYHSSKGLDFDSVFLPGLDSSLKIWKDEEDMERRLFYVAATRSRRNLFISYSGSTPHRFVSGMPRDLVETIEIRPPQAQGGNDNFDDVF